MQRALQAVHREVVAEVVASRAARRTESTRHDEGAGDLGSDRRARNARTERRDGAGDLDVPSPPASGTPLRPSHPVQVCVTHAAAHAAASDENLSPAGLGNWNLLDVQPARGALRGLPRA